MIWPTVSQSSTFIASFFYFFVSPGSAFYLPGLAPNNFCVKEIATKDCKSKVDLFVNRLNSEESVIPYNYNSFDFCPANVNAAPVENLGQIVFGERIQLSLYDIEFLKNEECKLLCQPKKYQAAHDANLARLINGILLNYYHHWIVDNMPVRWCFSVGSLRQCKNGFPMGCYVNSNHEINVPCAVSSQMLMKLADTFIYYNHVDLNISYHSGEGEEWGERFSDPTRGGRIVSVRVSPRSISHESADNLNCGGDRPLLTFGPKTLPPGSQIIYTYSVNFVKDNSIKWSSRWDHILEANYPQSNIQWFSIFNSLIIVLFLSGMVAMILLRTLHKDILRYNQDSGEEAAEEFGWKLVHGDVFRPPRKTLLLSVLVGSGTQVLIMAAVTLVFACLGFLSPANRGSLMTCALVLYVCLGTSAGYVSARLYKSLGGERWKTNVLLTAMLCPGSVFGMFFVLNVLLWIEDSSGAVPFSTLVALLALWFGISVPLTFVGAYFGFRKRALDFPVRTNQIPRQIPEQTIYTQPLPGIIMGGVLPFGCIFIQLFFILNSIWASQTYYMFGFLFLVFLILILTCSETTVLLCYFHLCAEDYHWWWRSFLTSGFTAFYLFLYCFHFFLTKLEIQGASSTFLYFGYTAIMVSLFFLLTGTIGFFACFWFVRKIYSVVKVD